MMLSAYKLNKQGDNIRPWYTPFPIVNQLVVPCLVLTVASWPSYRFLRRQIRWSSTSISLRVFYSLLYPHKGFSVVSEAEVDVLLLLFLWSSGCWQFDLWFLCLFETQVVHLEVLGSRIVEAWLERLLSVTLLACEMSTNCAVVRAFFGIALP